MKVTFDGPNKLITINDDVTYIDVGTDLYSAWKHWWLEDDNSKYAQAFRTFGGDPTNADGTQFAPQYFFLMNGWRVVVDGTNVTFHTNLYTDEGESPYIIKNNGSVSAAISDAQVVDLSRKIDNNIWELLLSEHHQPGTFGELMQKIFVNASKSASISID